MPPLGLPGLDLAAASTQAVHLQMLSARCAGSPAFWQRRRHAGRIWLRTTYLRPCANGPHSPACMAIVRLAALPQPVLPLKEGLPDISGRVSALSEGSVDTCAC